MPRAAGYDDPGRAEFWALGFDERLILEPRNLGRGGGADPFDRSLCPFAGRLKRGRSHRNDFLGIG
jgi:hypothetical protein